MYCTKCGVELRDQVKFCSDCGTSTTRAVPLADRLVRPMREAKVAGVCAGFARYFGIDVTLVRILWVALTVLPVPFCGLVIYIVCWIVMPKDEGPVRATSMQAANGPAS